MGDHLARAVDFENRADKKLGGWGIFGSKYEDAADLLDKASNAFKLAKSCNWISLLLRFMFSFSFSVNDSIIFVFDFSRFDLNLQHFSYFPQNRVN